MELIDFSASSVRAFRHGFLKGLSAPAMLFCDFAPPAIPTVGAVSPIAPPDGPEAVRLARDWQTIGRDLSRVLGYEVATQA